MAIHYNPGPLRRMLHKASSRRIDIAGLWNSEGTFASSGWETGLFLAMWARYECYGGMALSFGASIADDTAVDSNTGPNWGSTTHDNYYRNFNNGATWTDTKAQRASAPSANRAAFDVTGLTAGKWAPHFPMYHGGGTIGGWVNFELKRFSVRENPIPIEDAMTVTFWGGEFTTGGGNFTPVWRYNGGTAVITFGAFCYAGTNGVMKKTEVSHSADASRASGSSLQLHCTTFNNNLFLTWIRFCRTNQATGFAVHPFYGCQGMSIYDMYEQFLLFPATSWYHWFDVMTNYQGADLSQHCAVFDLYEGSNFVGESSVAGGAPVPGTPDHPDNYLWYIKQIVTHIEGLWELSGRSLENLAFRVRCSHPINDPSSIPPYRFRDRVQEYRDKLLTMDFTAYPRVTVCDMHALASREEMIAAGDYADSTHLSYGGYTRLEEASMRDLMSSGRLAHGFGGRTRSGLRYRG